MNRIAKILNSPGSAESWPPPLESGGGQGDPAPPAPWPGIPAPPPASSHDVEIERGRLRRLQAELPAAARPLEEAVKKLVGLQVSEASFTSFTYSLAIAYSEVEAYTLQELKHKAEETVEIQDGIRLSADSWEAAENASTIKWV